jgi:glycine oxidase
LEVDYLIVGSGIAGTSLAFRLEQKGHSYVLVDVLNPSSASNVSAGICNPVVFRRLNLSWMADCLLIEALRFYTSMEKWLDVPLVERKPIVKVFSSAEERLLWKSKMNDVELVDRLTLKDQVFNTDFIDAPNGGGIIHGALQIRMPELLAAFRKRALASGKLIECPFDYTDLHFVNEKIQWKQVVAKRIVFCEGHTLNKNPFFKWLPMKPVKGEVIVLRIENMPSDLTLNKQLMLHPMGNNLWWLGSTYDWANLDETPTAEAKQELLQKLNDFLKVAYTVVDHKAGIRPAASDRRPLLGQHPTHSQLYVFNGFGTKGSMIAPYFSTQLMNNMEYNTPLLKEVDILRHYKHFHEMG